MGRFDVCSWSRQRVIQRTTSWACTDVWTGASSLHTALRRRRAYLLSSFSSLCVLYLLLIVQIQTDSLSVQCLASSVPPVVKLALHYQRVSVPDDELCFVWSTYYCGGFVFKRESLPALWSSVGNRSPGCKSCKSTQGLDDFPQPAA